MCPTDICFSEVSEFQNIAKERGDFVHVITAEMDGGSPMEEACDPSLCVGLLSCVTKQPDGQFHYLSFMGRWHVSFLFAAGRSNSIPTREQLEGFYWKDGQPHKVSRN